MGGHGAWNENQQHYKYSKEEIEAYQVPMRIKAGPCVDTYIPLKKCFQENPTNFAAKMLDGRKGKCAKQFNYYNTCLNHWQTYENNSHVTNAYWADTSKAQADGISNTFGGNYRKGLAWLN
ncbi:hypothetical protein ABPG72_009711 [Tetrahymena utriculariae]